MHQQGRLALQPLGEPAYQFPGLLLPNHHSLSSLHFALPCCMYFACVQDGLLVSVQVAECAGDGQMQAEYNSENGCAEVARESGVSVKARANCWLRRSQGSVLAQWLVYTLYSKPTELVCQARQPGLRKVMYIFCSSRQKVT